MQAVIPGGSSVPVLDENDCQEVMMDFDDLKVRALLSLRTVAKNHTTESNQLISQ